MRKCICILFVLALLCGCSDNPVQEKAAVDKPGSPPAVSEPDKTPAPTDTKPEEKETVPKIAVAQFWRDEYVRHNPISLANYLADRLKCEFEIVRPVQTNAILNSIGLRVANLADLVSAQKLHTERKIKYLILCSLVQNEDFIDIEGQLIDCENGKVKQSCKLSVPQDEIKGAVGMIAEVLFLDDAGKHIRLLDCTIKIFAGKGDFEHAIAALKDAVDAKKIDSSSEEVKQLSNWLCSAIMSKAGKALQQNEYLKAGEIAKLALSVKPESADVMTFIANAEKQYKDSIVRVPKDYKTIQEAIDNSSSGGVILVEDGVYKGKGNREIDFKAKSLTLKSQNGPARCIIDCEKSGRGFRFLRGEGPKSVVEGVTVKNGFAEEDTGGGGIKCDNNSSPTIRNCIIEKNTASGIRGHGGGIFCYNDSNPVIVNCVIRENRTGAQGGGIACRKNSNPTILGCLVARNYSRYNGGGINVNNSRSVISSCTIVMNCSSMHCGGVCCVKSPITISNTVIWKNYLKDSQGWAFQIGSYGDNRKNGLVTLENCILPDEIQESKRFGHSSWDGVIYVKDSCNETDPKMVNLHGGDYHLKPDSPCINKGDNKFVLDKLEKDLDSNARIVGKIVDIGAYEHCEK